MDRWQVWKKKQKKKNKQITKKKKKKKKPTGCHQLPAANDNESIDMQMGPTQILPAAHLHGGDVGHRDVIFTQLHVLYDHPHHQRTDFSCPQSDPLHSRCWLDHVTPRFIWFHAKFNLSSNGAGGSGLSNVRWCGYQHVLRSVSGVDGRHCLRRPRLVPSSVGHFSTFPASFRVTWPFDYYFVLLYPVACIQWYTIA